MGENSPEFLARFLAVVRSRCEEPWSKPEPEPEPEPEADARVSLLSGRAASGAGDREAEQAKRKIKGVAEGRRRRYTPRHVVVW